MSSKSNWNPLIFTFHQDLSRAFSAIDNDLVDSLIIQLSRVNVKAVDAAFRCESDASWGGDRFVILEPLGRFVRMADLALKVQLLFLVDRDVGQGSHNGCWQFWKQIQPCVKRNYKEGIMIVNIIGTSVNEQQTNKKRQNKTYLYNYQNANATPAVFVYTSHCSQIWFGYTLTCELKLFRMCRSDSSSKVRLSLYEDVCLRRQHVYILFKSILFCKSFFFFFFFFTLVGTHNIYLPPRPQQSFQRHWQRPCRQPHHPTQQSQCQGCGRCLQIWVWCELRRWQVCHLWTTGQVCRDGWPRTQGAASVSHWLWCWPEVAQWLLAVLKTDPAMCEKKL